MKQKNRICTQCVMDGSDPLISFDDEGVCNHCRDYEEKIDRIPSNPDERKKILNQIVDEIRDKGKNSEYDCIVGVSGGVDSTYVAYLVKKLGLRPLAIHMDNGWNSELSVSNIEKCLSKYEIDLLTRVLDWEEFRNLQKAFLRASVPDGEIPTDHAILAVLYQEAIKHKVSFIITGHNLVTEGILPKSWSAGHRDWRYIKAINKRFGEAKLNNFPHFSYLDLFYYFVIRRLRVVNILDYVDYNKTQIMNILQDEMDWRPYPAKHYESIYTRFFQRYVLPEKFGYDKRKAHLSTLINSGQMSRAEALEALAAPPLSGQMLEDDMDFVLKKLGFSEEEFQDIMALPKRSYKDYPNQDGLYSFLMGIQAPRLLQKIGLMGKTKY